MRIGLYGYPDQEIRRSAEKGLRRLGHDIVAQVPSCWNVGQALKDLDGVVVCGTRGPCGEVARHYERLGVPVAVIDVPHLGREKSGQMRVAPPGYSWLPELEKRDPSRLEKLGIVVAGPRTPKKAQIVLVLGQSSADPSIGMARHEVKYWAEGVIEPVRSLCDWKVVWRPDPSEVYPVGGADEMSDPKDRTLEEDFDAARLVITHSSDLGLEALIAGLPVIADGDPVYKPLCGSLSEWSKLHPPSEDELVAFLEVLAHTQWTSRELTTGLPFRPFFADETAFDEPAQAAQAYQEIKSKKSEPKAGKPAKVKA